MCKLNDTCQFWLVENDKFASLTNHNRDLTFTFDVKRAHSDSQNYFCEMCNSIFTSIEYLTKHSRIVHGGDRFKNIDWCWTNWVFVLNFYDQIEQRKAFRVEWCAATNLCIANALLHRLQWNIFAKHCVISHLDEFIFKSTQIRRNENMSEEGERIYVGRVCVSIIY